GVRGGSARARGGVLAHPEPPRAAERPHADRGVGDVRHPRGDLHRGGAVVHRRRHQPAHPVVGPDGRREPAVPPLVLVPVRIPLDRHRRDHAVVHLLRRRRARCPRPQDEVKRSRDRLHGGAKGGSTMRMPDEQLNLFEQRLAAMGVGRRDFLKVVGAMAAFGGLGFATTAQAQSTKPAPGDKLAKDQVFRFGGGGYYQNDPASHDFNKDLYCSGVPALFAGLMVFNADFVAMPWMASKVEGNKDGSVWTFTIRKDTRWSDNSPVSARDFEWSWKRQLDPASAAPYASFL